MLFDTIKRIAMAMTAVAFPFACLAQDIIVNSAESVGMASINTISATENIYSLNPAMMSEVEKAEIAANYVMPYGMKELSQVEGKAVVATRLANLTMYVAQSGDESSHYTEIGGGLSRKFGGKWGMGMEYYALAHALSDNQKYWTGFSRIGLHFTPNEKWMLTVTVQNIEQREIEYLYTKGKIESVAWAGLKWRGSRLFAFMAEAEKRWEHDAVVKVAAGIYPTDRLNFTVGFSTKGQSLSAGVGYTWKGVGLHAGLMHHEQLGVTSGGSVSYIFGR